MDKLRDRHPFDRNAPGGSFRKDFQPRYGPVRFRPPDQNSGHDRARNG
ncbi:hypothetical protein [Synechococcus sp. M16CYN]